MKKLVIGVLVVLALISFILAIGAIHEVKQAEINPDNYHFGSEAMLGEGGSHYSSQQTYIEHYQFWGGIAVATFVLLSGASCFVYRKNRAR